MEAMGASVDLVQDNDIAGTGRHEANVSGLDGFKNRVDEILMKVDQLEQRVNEVEHFYLNASKKQVNSLKGSSVVMDKDKERQIPSLKKQQLDASRREAAATKRMQELMRQFGTILRQITQHKWAWPFMQPVDVKGLGLDDYYEVIDKPMDFSTIKNQMEAKDGTGYKNVREICADVRLVFKNAMKYNGEKSDVHVMAKTLLEKFEERWLQLLPKVTEEEKRREEEESAAQMDMQLAREAAYAKLARDISNELYEVDSHLEELREMVVRKCRTVDATPKVGAYTMNSWPVLSYLCLLQAYKMGRSLMNHFEHPGAIDELRYTKKISTEEKRNIGTALSLLAPEDLLKALEIVAQNDPNFQSTAEEINLDMDAQSESTLWRLKFFVKDALEVQGKTSLSTGGDDNNTNNTNKNKNNSSISNQNKRKREICDAITKSAKKRSKKPS